MKVRLSAAARRDLLSQIDWLADQAPRAAREAAAKISYRLSLLADFPEASPLSQRGHREAVVLFGRDGFVIRYRVDPEQVTVLRIFHGRQRR